jgi:hypothetical protein
VKKIAVALGALLVLALVSSGPAGAGDISYVRDRAVSLTGTPAVGATLTVVPGTWTPAPGSRRYEWLRDGEDDVLSRAASYLVSPDDLGHTLVVVERVTFGAQQDDSSYQTPVVVAAGPAVAALTAPAATVSGTRKVGRTLRVTLSGGTPGASTAIQWLRDGSPIHGATSATYVPAKADGGRSITVRTTSTSAGLTPVPGSSNAVRIPAVNTKRPTLKGTTKVGKRLKVKSKGTWYAAGHHYTYQWLRSGKKIKGATKSSYKLTKKDRKKTITVRVYARKSGFPTVSAASSKTSRIR